MTISSALNNAGSGLAAAARAIQVASGNVANAMTPGYAPRSLQLAAATLGGQGAGVRVAGVERQADPVLQGLLRSAEAMVAGTDSQSRFWAAIEGALGLPDSPSSLSGRLAALDSALIAAVDRPDLESRLSAVVDAAEGLLDGLGRVEDALQSQRLAAEAAIARDTAALNEGLERLHRLNLDIASLQASGIQALDLQDEREALLVSLSEIVPLKSHARPDGRMLVYTESGAVLLDLQPAKIGFAPVPVMTAGMSLDEGHLSGLTVNGQAVPTGPGGPLSGGRLEAEFALRDREGVSLQSTLDALAASLIERFQAPGTDPSASPGAPGLFTDAGAALGLAPPPGLAGRIALNPLVQPAEGGALWRLRDGLGAAAPGPVGDNAQLDRWRTALDRPFATLPGGALQSFAQQLDETLSAVGQSHQQVTERAIHAGTFRDTLHQQQLDGGVDVDAEMRRLLGIETAYAANARVIQVADEMLRRLMEI